MPPEDRVRLRHMIEAASAITGFVRDRQRGDLDNDQMLALAVMRAIEIIGEAASRISESTRAAAPDVPWSQIISMRNRLIHAYFDVDHNIHWKTATEEVPQLAVQLRALADRT